MQQQVGQSPLLLGQIGQFLPLLGGQRTAGSLTPQPIQLLPYYAWNNREPVDMSVWLPLR